MLDSNIDLYGPYARPLLNCGGGGTCGTCIVEVIEGKELLTPRTDKEKEKLKRVIILTIPINLNDKLSEVNLNRVLLECV